MKPDMCLSNMDDPIGNKVKIWQKSLLHFDPAPPHPQGHLMSVKCEEPIDELTVQVWLLYHHPNFKYCALFVSKTELQTDRQTDDSIYKMPPVDLLGWRQKIKILLTVIFREKFPNTKISQYIVRIFMHNTVVFMVSFYQDLSNKIQTILSET